MPVGDIEPPREEQRSPFAREDQHELVGHPVPDGHRGVLGGNGAAVMMTEDSACCRSRDFAKALCQIKYRRTRPYRPPTNGKVERHNRTLTQEWAYAEVYASDDTRAATYPEWLHYYNHHRPHTGIGGQVPADRVHDVTGNYS